MTRWYPLWARRLLCRLRDHRPERLTEHKQGSSATVVVCGRCFGVIDARTYKCQFPLPRGGNA